MLRKYLLLLCSILTAALFVAGIAILNVKPTVAQTVSHPPVKKPVPVTGEVQPAPEVQETEPMTMIRTSYNVLLMIPDKSSANTDVMLLFNYSPDTGKMNVLTLPRDTRVEIDTSIPKLNSVYSIGESQKVYEVLEQLLGVRLDYFVFVDLKGFRKIVDTLGGVDFNIPIDIDYDDPTQDLSIHFQKGPQHLNGKQSEEFLRYRKTPDEQYSREMLKYYDGSDTKRTEMQMAFLKEFIRQKAKLSNLGKISEILDITSSHVKTDMPLDVIFNLAQSVLSHKDLAMNSFRLTGRDTYIKKIYYTIFEGKIINTTSNETLDASDVIQEYFTTMVPEK